MQKGNLMKKTKLWLGLSSVGILFTTSLISLTNVALDNEGLINDVLKLNVRKISSKRSDYAEEDGSLSDAGWKRMIQDSYKYCVEQEEQGAVLLKNENNCLPLSAKERNVTLFGRNSAHLCLRSGAGGAAPNKKLVVHLNDAFENNGFNYNKEVWNLYKGGAEPSETSIVELPESSYTHGIQASFTTFSDAAIVTFVRVGTENSDPKAGILDLQENEANLLRMIKKSGKFKKTIVLLNGAMPMSLDWASKEEFGVDAVLWFGVPGYYSLDGVVHILTGEANPSGHTPDTFSAHASNSAAGREDGVRHAVGAVGEEDGAVGVAVDDVLQRVGHIGLSIIADEVGHRHVVLVVLLLCLALGMGEHGACDEHDEQCGDGQHGGP